MLRTYHLDIAFHHIFFALPTKKIPLRRELVQLCNLHFKQPNCICRMKQNEKTYKNQRKVICFHSVS